MSKNIKERVLPCTSCKNRHLKCEPHTPCHNCKKSSLQCLRAKKSFRFKKTAQPKHTFTFDSHQTWLATHKHDALSYVDETREVTRASTGVAPLDSSSDEELAAEHDNHTAENAHQIGSASSLAGGTVETPTSSRPLDAIEPNAVGSQYDLGQELELQDVWVDSHDLMDISPGRVQTRSMSQNQVALTIPADGQPVSSTSPRANLLSPTLTTSSLTSRSQLANDPPHPSYSFPSPYYTSPDALHGLPEKATHQAYTNLQEACLVKHFVNNIAYAFETTDRDRHFSIVVPQRAMFCPVLLYAILTASARHLTRWHSTNSNKPIEFEGIPLPDLNENSAIEYHNVCITFLREVLNDPKKTINQDALIAATILRYHEQLDTSLTGWDPETYLSVLRGVIESQQNESFYSLRTIHGPPRDYDIYSPNNASLAHSACLIALAQEIWSVLLYRRPFRLPLCPDNDYSNLDGAVDDFTWTNRLMIWCADVCKFAFGGEGGVLETGNRVERWKRLKVVQDKWDTVQPACFKPLYYSEADPPRGQYFAKEWHMNECQVLALQHFELTRMLLAAYDPQLQRIGLGTSSSVITLEAQLRRSTMRLCSLALANVKWQPGMVTAAVGISMCGEYIRDAGEQSAIEDFLNTLEREHAWPTQKVKLALRDAWGARRKQEGVTASVG